jgi:hypothetical protein
VRHGWIVTVAEPYCSGGEGLPAPACKRDGVVQRAAERQVWFDLLARDAKRLRMIQLGVKTRRSSSATLSPTTHESFPITSPSGSTVTSA